MTRLAVVILLLVVPFTLACGRSEQVAPPQAEQKATEKELLAKKIADVEAEAERKTREKAEREKAEADRRASEVSQLRVNLSVLKGEKSASAIYAEGRTTPAWEVTIRQGVATDTARACEFIERHHAGEWVWNTLEGHYSQRFEKPISYEEVGATPKQLQELRRTVGLAAAKALHAVLENPQKGVTCGRGEGSFALDNGADVAERLIQVLRDIEAAPAAIGTTPAALRASVLKSLRAEVAEVRKAFKEGKGSRSDFYAPAISDIGRRGGEWKFAPQEIGLNAEELAFLKN